MSDVKQFDLDGTVINVKDETARNDAATASSQVTALAGRVTALENLSRLTLTYDSQTEVLTFTTTTH